MRRVKLGYQTSLYMAGKWNLPIAPPGGGSFMPLNMPYHISLNMLVVR